MSRAGESKTSVRARVESPRGQENHGCGVETVPSVEISVEMSDLLTVMMA